MDTEFAGITLEIDETAISEPRREIRRQLDAYRSGDRSQFDLTVEFPESFTGRVMRAMSAIPYGETRTYGDIASELGTSPIAVGQACGRNPVPIVVPCHRVVAKNGLGGFSAGGDHGQRLKQSLLDHEREGPAAES